MLTKVDALIADVLLLVQGIPAKTNNSECQLGDVPTGHLLAAGADSQRTCLAGSFQAASQYDSITA
jgi:uncharacterized protein YejL (UPF0352 family)